MHIYTQSRAVPPLGWEWGCCGRGVVVGMGVGVGRGLWWEWGCGGRGFQGETVSETKSYPINFLPCCVCSGSYLELGLEAWVCLSEFPSRCSMLVYPATQGTSRPIS